MILYFFIYAAVFIATGLFGKFSNAKQSYIPCLVVAGIGFLFTLFMIGVAFYNMFTGK